MSDINPGDSLLIISVVSVVAGAFMLIGLIVSDWWKGKGKDGE